MISLSPARGGGGLFFMGKRGTMHRLELTTRQLHLLRDILTGTLRAVNRQDDTLLAERISELVILVSQS